MSAIEVHSWILGPWSDVNLECEGFFLGTTCKHVSHEGWVAMFTATEESQTMSISWNDRKFESGHGCDAPAFQALVRQF